MDCLVNLTGTKFDQVKSFNERYKEDGIIWYLESCDLNVFGIRRAIWQMIHAGWFEHVKGFLIGRPLHFGEEMSTDGSGYRSFSTDDDAYKWKHCICVCRKWESKDQYGACLSH